MILSSHLLCESAATSTTLFAESERLALQGLLGQVVFGEALTKQWFIGMTFILAGLVLVTKACSSSKPLPAKLA